MQNEITELRNQVRTLKRIVYGFGCLLVLSFLGGCKINLFSDIDSEDSRRFFTTLSDPMGFNEEITVAPSDELCCQHPHHLECIVNSASAPPGSCQHSHHLECGVTNTK